jgi:hypothetical protein
MSSKTDFSSSEWETLRDAPHYVVLAVAGAGASGLIGSIAEAIAPSSAFVEAGKGVNLLLQDICDKEQIKASIQAIKEALQGMGEGGHDFSVIQSTVRKMAIEKSRIAIDLLRQKGFSEDVVVYRDFLLNLGDKVANAAKEGSFLGFGGERVSEAERQLMAELAQAVGGEAMKT